MSASTMQSDLDNIEIAFLLLSETIAAELDATFDALDEGVHGLTPEQRAAILAAGIRLGATWRDSVAEVALQKEKIRQDLEKSIALGDVLAQVLFGPLATEIVEAEEDYAGIDRAETPRHEPEFAGPRFPFEDDREPTPQETVRFRDRVFGGSH